MKQLVLLLSVLAFAAPSQSAETYTIDASHSVVAFSVRHMMVATTKGAFADVKGTVVADAEDLSRSSVQVEIAVASINTNNADRDNHLRAPDFFDAAKYPMITFKSNKIEKKGDGYVATGMLTIKGVSREIALPFSVAGPITDPWGNVRYGLEFERVKINRQDFGLTWSKVMETGGLVVGNEVTLELATELIREKPKA